MVWKVLPISSAGLSRSALKNCDFDCALDRESPKPGEISLNNFLKKNALRRDAEGFAKTYVILSNEGDLRVIGYCSLSSYLVEPSNIPNSSINLPPHPIPCILLGRWAVDSSMQGRGVGRVLLRHAFEVAIEFSEKVAAYAIVAEPIDEKVRLKYLDYGFLPLEDTLNVYIEIAFLRQAREASQKTTQA